MKKITIQLSALAVAFAVLMLLSCKTSGVLPGRVPYREYVDSLSKVVKKKDQMLTKKQYKAKGGATYDKLKAFMMLHRAVNTIFSEEKYERDVRASLSRWLDHPLDIGGFPAEYQLSSNETVRVLTRFYNGRSLRSTVFVVDSGYVEKDCKRIPIEIHSAHFTMVRNPPLEYVFTCNFKYKRKWYSLYHHVDIEKRTLFKGHETKCERLQ